VSSFKKKEGIVEVHKAVAFLKEVKDKVEERRQNNEKAASVARLLAYFQSSLTYFLLTSRTYLIIYFLQRQNTHCFPHCWQVELEL
jgi:hypothetical protein